jgi:hypothetical protein
MARGDIKHYEVDWDKFCQFVIERWRNKIIERDVYDTGNLYRSLTYNYRGTNSLNQTVGRGSGATLKIPDMVSFSFPMYGIYADRGAGRGLRIKSHWRGKGHSQWFYSTFATERRRLGELVAEAYGRAAMEQILTIEHRTSPATE